MPRGVSQQRCVLRQWSASRLQGLERGRARCCNKQLPQRQRATHPRQSRRCHLRRRCRNQNCLRMCGCLRCCHAGAAVHRETVGLCACAWRAAHACAHGHVHAHPRCMRHQRSGCPHLRPMRDARGWVPDPEPWTRPCASQTAAAFARLQGEASHPHLRHRPSRRRGIHRRRLRRDARALPLALSAASLCWQRRPRRCALAALSRHRPAQIAGQPAQPPRSRRSPLGLWTTPPPGWRRRRPG
mmetsp:Transcript_18769/g.55926  ORF Transcript_18769/g.55926 Transcript_18769/m.55926 type:complete len:242 (+) Transcript_18769:1321-2046(+)